MNTFYGIAASVLLLVPTISMAQCSPSEQIEYSQQITSICRATVQMPDGRHISVPVVNGMLPDVQEYQQNGVVVTRLFTYKTQTKYNGGIPKYCSPSQKPPVITESWDKLKAPQPVPVPEAKKSPEKPKIADEDLSKSLSEIREQLRTLNIELERLRNQPRIAPAVEPMLKRPSEIKDK